MQASPQPQGTRQECSSPLKEAKTCIRNNTLCVRLEREELEMEPEQRLLALDPL